MNIYEILLKIMIPAPCCSLILHLRRGECGDRCQPPAKKCDLNTSVPLRTIPLSLTYVLLEKCLGEKGEDCTDITKSKFEVLCSNKQDQHHHAAMLLRPTTMMEAVRAVY